MPLQHPRLTGLKCCSQMVTDTCISLCLCVLVYYPCRSVHDIVCTCHIGIMRLLLLVLYLHAYGVHLETGWSICAFRTSNCWYDNCMGEKGKEHSDVPAHWKVTVSPSQTCPRSYSGFPSDCRPSGIDTSGCRPPRLAVPFAWACERNFLELVKFGSQIILQM